MIIKGGIEFREMRMAQILFRQDGVPDVHTPVNSQSRVGYRDTTVGLRSIIIVAFILENGLVAEHCESVGETTGHKKLTVVFSGKKTGDVASVCGRPFADVEGDIQDSSADTSHKLCLGMGWTLEVEAAHHSTCGAGFVVLHKIGFADNVVKDILSVALEEIAPLVAEYRWLKDDYSRYFCLDYLHC